MILVSDAWKNVQPRFILPESFLEISCFISEPGAQETAVASGTIESFISNVGNITGNGEGQTSTKYATLEHNLWTLDGTMSILPTEGPYANAGYVSDIAHGGSVTLTLPKVHTELIGGVTIIWSSEYDECPAVFTVTAKNGDTVVAETTVTDNTSNKSFVYMEISNYDSVTVTVHNWCVPDHRSRIDSVRLGLDLTFEKKDILSYTHEQHGNIFSGELPKNSIEFSVDNLDSRWNPNNPAGLEQYLSERQKVTVRYGMDVDGTIEWIKAGSFYLSEWRTPSNGIAATFVARDMLEFMINEPYTGTKSGTLLEIAEAAIAQAALPYGTVVEIDPSLGLYSGQISDNHTIAEVLQMCANASLNVMYQRRDGAFVIGPMGTDGLSDYVIPLSMSYAYPEVELSKRLKNVLITYGPGGIYGYSLAVANSGETQTLSNNLISGREQAQSVAEWVKNGLIKRQIVSGEFRADPRLDLFDLVTIESKFGNFSPVVITDIKYTFSGAFMGSYTGRVIA